MAKITGASGKRTLHKFANLPMKLTCKTNAFWIHVGYYGLSVVPANVNVGLFVISRSSNVVLHTPHLLMQD